MVQVILGSGKISFKKDRIIKNKLKVNLKKKFLLGESLLQKKLIPLERDLLLKKRLLLDKVFLQKIVFLRKKLTTQN